MADRITFTRPSADRIARVVRKVEAGDLDQQGFSFQVRDSAGKGCCPRHVAWSTTWRAGETATITFSVGTATATAINVFAGVDAGSGWVARHSGTWHLVVCNLTTQPNYASGDVQMLGHDDDGILRWYTTVECDDAESEE